MWTGHEVDGGSLYSGDWLEPRAVVALEMWMRRATSQQIHLWGYLWHTYIYMHIHSYAYAYIHIRAYTSTYAHIHSYSYTTLRVLLSSRKLSKMVSKMYRVNIFFCTYSHMCVHCLLVLRQAATMFVTTVTFTITTSPWK